MKNQNQYINSRRSFLKATGLLGGAALIPSFFLASCKKGFLDREPLDSVTDISFWKTEEQLKLAANACYSNLRNNNTIAMEKIWATIPFIPLIQNIRPFLQVITILLLGH